MAQYKITTLFLTQGAREYYQDADSADEATQAFQKQIIKNNQAKETIYMMTEEITDIICNEDTRIDLDELEEARRNQWEASMQQILENSRKKLRDTMGFGIHDEPKKLKS